MDGSRVFSPDTEVDENGEAMVALAMLESRLEPGVLLVSACVRNNHQESINIKLLKL